MIATLTRWSHRLALGGAVLASILFLMLVGLIMTEIIGRSFFNYSTMLADEYSGYLYLAAVFLGLAYTFEQEGHIRITILTAKVRPAIRRWADIVAGIMATLMLGYALYYSWGFMMESHEMGMVSEGVSETPLYLTQIPLVIGLGLFVIATAVFTLKMMRHD